MKKAYNAISEWFKKTLIIDDGQQPISYKRQDFCNDFNYIKINTLKELYDYFKSDNSDIFLCNTESCLILVSNTGEELSLHKYCNQYIKFIKLISLELSANDDSEILIAANSNHYISNNALSWQSFYKLINTDIPDFEHIKTWKENKQIASLDLNGYQNTKNLLKANPMPETMQAIDYCISQKITINNTVYQGYLPAIGQLKIMAEYIDIINYLFEKTENDKLYLGHHTMDTIHYYSSSEFSNTAAWNICNGNLNASDKSCEFQVLPFFKKIQI